MHTIARYGSWHSCSSLHPVTFITPGWIIHPTGLTRVVDMEGNNVIVYAVVGIIIGAIIGVGVGYVMWNGSSDDNNTTDPNTETYNYYLYFGDDDQRTGWYSAEGTDAATAFDSAMKAADIEYTVSNYGYIGSIGGEDGAITRMRSVVSPESRLRRI